MNYKLGILDQSPVFPGTTYHHALQHTVRLAQKAEDWGYKRFWVSEHHQMEQVAGSSPEVLISYLLALTNSIRVGSGGVMLQHYSPYKVVENFHVLATLTPGRVDLGIGKSPGGFPLSTKGLQFGTMNDGNDFEERLALLCQLTEESVHENHPLAGIQATPIPPESPETFLLGTSAKSAQLAADLEMGFVFAQFIDSKKTSLEEAAKTYRERNPKGCLIVAVAVIAAPTQQEAEELANSLKPFKIHLQSGRTLTVQSREQVLTFEKQAKEPYEIEELTTKIIAGTPVYIHEVLTQLKDLYQVDEFILHTPLQKEAERLRSFQLLSPKQINKEINKIVHKSNQ